MQADFVPCNFYGRSVLPSVGVSMLYHRGGSAFSSFLYSFLCTLKNKCCVPALTLSKYNVPLRHCSLTFTSSAASREQVELTALLLLNRKNTTLRKTPTTCPPSTIPSLALQSLLQLLLMVITNLTSCHARLTSPGSVPLRLEIRQLQQNADQWNLYLLGLDAFKKMDEKSDLSYYGVCGQLHTIR